MSTQIDLDPNHWTRESPVVNERNKVVGTMTEHHHCREAVLREALEIIAAPPTDGLIPVSARNVARVALDAGAR